MRPCAFCPEVVDETDANNYREVSSWVSGPKLDGSKLRDHTGRVAHRKCVENLAHGQAPDQPELFREDGPEPTRWPKKREQVAYCEAQAVSGLCGTALSPTGECWNVARHIE